MSPLLRTFCQPTLSRSLAGSRTTVPSTTVAGRRFAHQDYGSGDANINKPNPSADKEHPGPPPPKAAEPGNSQQQKTSSGAKPKILSDNPPAEGEQSEEVAKHNREVSQRYDRAEEKVKNQDAENDKVPKGFWSGGSDK